MDATVRPLTMALLSALLLATGSSPAVADDSVVHPLESYIVVLDDSVDNPALAAARQTAQLGVAPSDVYSSVKAYSVELSSAEADDLALDPQVDFVAPNSSFALAATAEAQLCGTTVGESQCLPSSLARIEADKSSAASGDGTGRVGGNVAILDTGIESGHPDLRVVGGVDCGSGSPQAFVEASHDHFGHGTEVAGVIGAVDDGTGVVGVAPGISLYAVNLVDDVGSITLLTLVCGIDWVTSTRLDSDVSNDIDIAIISLTGSGADDEKCGRRSHDPLHVAICASTRAGTTYVAAAGNDGVDIAQVVPASYDEVIAVTAMTDVDGRPGALGRDDCSGVSLSTIGEADDAPASFSNFSASGADTSHMLAAPGTCVMTTAADGRTPTYASVQGTSFSAPAVAGVLALCIAEGRCRDRKPKAQIRILIADAAAWNARHPDFGFSDKHMWRRYGHLVRSASY